MHLTFYQHILIDIVCVKTVRFVRKLCKKTSAKQRQWINMGRYFAPRSHDQRAKNRDERPEYHQNVVGTVDRRVKFEDDFNKEFKVNCRSKRQSINGIMG